MDLTYEIVILNKTSVIKDLRDLPTLMLCGRYNLSYNLLYIMIA